MSKAILKTQFAPAERASKQKIESQKKSLKDFPLLQKLYDAVSEAVLILNKERQIVFYNKGLQKLLKFNDKISLYSLRPGEAFQCIYSRINPAGCGTSAFCSTCGTAKVILSGLNNKEDVQECRITKYNSGDAYEFLVQSTPFNFENEKYVIFAVRDISDEKRRQFLERIFFHDILNTVSRLQLNIELLNKTHIKKFEDVKHSLFFEINKLTEEINTQKMLLAAENYELMTERVLIESGIILTELIRQYEKFAGIRKIKIIKEITNNISFMTDFSILLRVLGNMFKNAIEASHTGDSVKVKCYKTDKKINFSIQNQGVIPKDIQLQIFQRSFSTKGQGRGLGTYSMKLLTERYLKGNVFFISSKDKGTTFVASYPLNKQN